MGRSGDPRKRAAVEAVQDLVVRPARPGDGARLKSFWTRWVGVEFDNVMDAVDDGLLPDDVVVLCAESGRSRVLAGAVIAGPPYRLLRQLNLPEGTAEVLRGAVAKLEGVVVDPRVRSRGTGTVLVQRAIAACRRHGCQWMYGQFESSRNLTGFYQRLGFTVHPEGAALRWPNAFGRLPPLMPAPGDQWVDQDLGLPPEPVRTAVSETRRRWWRQPWWR